MNDVDHADEVDVKGVGESADSLAGAERADAGIGDHDIEFA